MNLFPRMIDGRMTTLVSLQQSMGISKRDIILAFERDPSITTLAGLKENIRLFKSRPIRHRPPPTSKRWNSCANDDTRPVLTNCAQHPKRASESEQ